MKRLWLALVFLLLGGSAAYGQCVTCTGPNTCGGGNKLECTFIENGCFAFGRCGGAAVAEGATKCGEPAPRERWIIASVRVTAPVAQDVRVAALSPARMTRPAARPASR